MRLRTLSARIIFGFVVLILTFGGISTLILHNMNRVSGEIRFILGGEEKDRLNPASFLDLVLTVKDLSVKQKVFADFLSKDFKGEDRREWLKIVKSRLRVFWPRRNRLLRDINLVLHLS